MFLVDKKINFYISGKFVHLLKLEKEQQAKCK